MKLIPKLHAMTPNEINQAALDYLADLLDRATLNLISGLTGITRTTLYRWLDEDLPLDAMNHRDSAWFIVAVETSPKVSILMSRPPLSHPRMAAKLLEGEDNEA